MRKLKFIGKSVKGTWTHYLTPGTIYEAYDSVEHSGGEIIRNDFFVPLQLNSERLRAFEVVHD